jgi:hypothetical protein
MCKASVQKIQYGPRVFGHDMPDLPTLNIEGCSSLDIVAARELLKHRSIVCRIVTRDVPNLYPKC